MLPLLLQADRLTLTTGLTTPLILVSLMFMLSFRTFLFNSQSLQRSHACAQQTEGFSNSQQFGYHCFGLSVIAIWPRVNVIRPSVK